MTSAGLVLAGTFSVFAVVGGRGSGGSQIRDVGIGLALGVLMDTFIVRTISRAVHGRPARPVELVAVRAQPDRPAAGRSGHDT